MDTQIDHRFVSRLLGIGRIAIGVALIVAPGRAGKGWIGPPATTSGGKMVLRALGARDIAIGYGVIHALDTGDPQARLWVTMAGASDLVDATATVLAFRDLPKRRRVLNLAIAAGAAAAAFVARDNLD